MYQCAVTFCYNSMIVILYNLAYSVGSNHCYMRCVMFEGTFRQAQSLFGSQTDVYQYFVNGLVYSLLINHNLPTVRSCVAENAIKGE